MIEPKYFIDNLMKDRREIIIKELDMVCCEKCRSFNLTVEEQGFSLINPRRYDYLITCNDCGHSILKSVSEEYIKRQVLRSNASADSIVGLEDRLPYGVILESITTGGNVTIIIETDKILESPSAILDKLRKMEIIGLNYIYVER